jgi:predicted nucleotidyltransferase
MILRQIDKENILKIAKELFGNSVKILVYGSRVSGEAHDTSDLDLAIISKDNKKLDIYKLEEFKERLRDSNIPILIQAIDWYRVPKSFHKNILSNYKELI